MNCNPDLQRFRMIRLPDDLQRKFDLPEIVCADPDGMPFLEGQAFYTWLIDKNGCQPATAINYLKSVLRFLSFLWFRSPPLRYTASTPDIREALEAYLRERLGCVVRPHAQGNLLITRSKTVTKHTVRSYLTALRRFYEYVIQQGWYRQANPLTWDSGLALPALSFGVARPQPELTALESAPGRRPATYFCVVADEWQPKIIDDPTLPQQFVAGLVYRRDQIITRMLFESGARVNEVLSLTVGDWRHLLGRRHGALATNKGSWGERVKEIWWSSETSQQLRLYLDGDRRQADPFGRRLDELPPTAPLFVTEKGNPYRYPAFYYHWRKACAQVGIKIHPHQARHWFVTMALRRIQALPNEEQREAYRQGLIAYMHWRSPDTIQAYDHHLRWADFSIVHAAIGQLVQEGQDELAVRQAHHGVEGRSEMMAVETTLDMSPEMWARLSQLFDEEETL